MNKPNGAACNDGNACTQTDACQNGSCVGANPVVCTADQCHDPGTCNPATGVCSAPTNKTNGTACNDGNACTQTDACQNGSCVGANPVVCTADQCHDPGTCKAPTRTPVTSANQTNRTACNDGHACKQTDLCYFVLMVRRPPGATPFPYTTLLRSCNPATGVCSAPTNKTNGTACNDGNACMQTDTCQNGSCVGANPVVCTADQCHDPGTCNPATGVCSAPPNKNNGTACNDGDACTQTDTCQNGSCVGASPVVCTALDQCHTAGTCDPATGTCSNPSRQDGTSCDDGDGCTVGDRCLGGTCTGVPRSCDDGVACTDDSCVAGECRHEPLDGRCDTGECFLAQCTPGAPGADAAGCTRAPVGEGDTCTSDDFACPEDVCTAGACRHVPIDGRCATGEACLPAICDPAGPGADPAGCVAVPERVNGMECAEDGDPCTDDTCMAGACAHAPVSNKAACDPVRPVYERALALAADARDLSALITGAL